MSEPEKTPNGDPIYRYEPSKRNELRLAIADETSIEEISKHIEKHLGKIESVFHEIVSDMVHVDIYWIKPTEKMNFHILVTSGMSDLPMTTPEGSDDWKYSELCILLPNTWNMKTENYELDKDVFSDEKNYWPIRWLKMLARFPHEYNTWLSWGHTVPNGEDAAPLADNTRLGCVMLYPAVNLPEEFFELRINDQKLVRFFCLIPLYKEEMNYKLNNGVDALIDKFAQFGVADIVEINRQNTCT
jgi:hypothetical protein